MNAIALEKCSGLSLVGSREPADTNTLRSSASHLRNVATFSADAPKKLSGLTASAGEVAAALGLKEASFRRKARSMHVKHGFPLPLLGASWTWSVRAVANWIEATGSIEQKETDAGADTRDAMEQQEEVGEAIVLAQHRALRERYAGRA